MYKQLSRHAPSVITVLLASLISTAPLCARQAAANPADALRLHLPACIYAAPNVEMNIYFDNIVLTPNPRNYLFDVHCAKGKHQSERWTFTPASEDAGDHPLSIEVRDGTNHLLAKAETVVKVVKAGNGAGRPVTVLTIGDSLTAANIYPAQLLALSAGESGPRITLVGRVRDTNSPLVRIEGYGGWTAERFTTLFNPARKLGPDEAIPAGKWGLACSPFLYERAGGGPTLDFPRYCQEFNHGKPPDFVTILLGCNDTFSATDESIEERIDTMLLHYDKLVEMVRQTSAATRIGVLLPVPPAATQDAFGANYACNQTRWQYRRNQHRMVERMSEKYGGRETENIHLVPTHVNLDCQHNYPSVNVPWNSETEEKGTRLNNGVHPAATGYRQIGNTLFCWIKAQL